MKMNTELRLVENNSAATKNFSIQASGKMFHMVISGLYSNKPQSITREIWSNAFDAHAMVGKEDVPFAVTFPTALNPTFSCRDFGPGIAHEDMEGFYTILGHSTKEGTNKAVGKWGVGRMSPMSYTDTFSVVSYHKGMVSYYAIQLGPDGSPQLHVLSEPQPTTEPDGLEVSFPVKRNDIGSFQTAADLVSYGFKVPPTVTNSKDKVFKGLEKLFEGKGYYIYKRNHMMSGPYAQMGCVMYPIPATCLVRNIDIVYQFDIGELEVTASRESLSFGPKDPTAAAISKKSEEVEEALWQNLQDQVDASPKLFDAAKLAQRLTNQLPSRSKPLTYKGKPIPRYWELDQYSNISVSSGYTNYRQTQAGWGNDWKIDLTLDYKIFVQNTGDKKTDARAARRIGKVLNSYERYIWVRANLKEAKAKSQVEKFIKDLGYPVTYVKDLPDPGPSKSTTTRNVQVSYIDTSLRVQKYDMPASVFADGGYYYPMSNNDFPDILSHGVGLLKEKYNVPIILVPKTLWKKFENAPKWKLLEIPLLEKVVKEEAGNVRKALGEVYCEYPLSNLVPFAQLSGPLGDFAKKTKMSPPTHYKSTSRSSWVKLFAYCRLPKLESDKPLQEYKALLDKYPLLKVFSGYNQYFASFAEYIQLIDEKNNQHAKGAN